MTMLTLRNVWRFAMWLTVLGLGLIGNGWAVETALDRYVAKPDSNYAFTHYHTQRGVGYTAYFLEMTSQQWRSASEVDRTLWKHEVALVIPQFGLDSSDTAILLIDGGSNGGALMTEVEQAVGAAAAATGAVIAVVRQVPNQPLYFSDDAGRGRKEDEILAYSLDKALDTGDMEWAVHLAMTKAAVRAMDTLQTFAASKGKQINDFLVLGGSKRGWTTWLAAAVDRRVKAIAPASIDMLNLGQQFVHHWEAYGFFAPALNDYVAFDLPCRVQTPQGKALLQVVDPYSYRDRYTLPKLILNATGDQFFATDSSRFYYADLPGPKWMRYTPNTDHKQGEDTIINALAWMDDILGNKTSPQIAWTLEENGALRVSPTTQPKQVRLWQATNLGARDFRLEAIGPVWTSQVLQPNADGSYVGAVQQSATGWTAFLIEVTFATTGTLKPDEVYTTGVQITPDTLPYAGTACGGTLKKKDAPGLYRNGAWFLDANGNGRWDGCPQNGGQDLCLGFGLPGDAPVAGDWAGTGKTAVGILRNGAWFLDANGNGRWDGCQQDGGQDLCLGFGLPGDAPVAGDWTGTGKTAAGIFRNGAWFLDANGNGRWDGCPQNGGQDLCLDFGLPGDMPVAGDWTGTGKTAAGIFRNGAWFLDANGNGRWDGCQQDGGQDLCLGFGLPGDMPVAGDWAGTGKTAVGIVRNGGWFLDANGNGRWDGCQQDGGQDFCLGFGLPGDRPAAGHW